MSEPRTLGELLRAPDPATPCLTELASGATLTYGETRAAARRIAGWLDGRGVGRGACVAWLARNDALIFPAIVACAARGAMLAPLDPGLHPDELGAALRRVNPAVIVDGAGARLTGRWLARRASLDELRASPPVEEAGFVDHGAPADPVLVIQTSGTTAGGKAVMTTQANILAMARSLRVWYRLSPSDRLLCVLPTHHMNALLITGFIPLSAGAHVFVGEVFGVQNARAYWQTVNQLGITIVSLVPSLLKLLLTLFPDGRDAAGSAVRFAFCGAAPLPADLWRRFESHFAMPVYQGYGLTETTFWPVCVPPDQPRRYDTVGRPVDCELRIRDGEVQLKGPFCMAGYFGAPALTRESFTEDGFLRTGDLGFVDEDGFLHITGRIKDIIIKNGNNISPADIDSLLAQHPAVDECRTLGLADEWVGERIHTVCILKPGHVANTKELREWLWPRISESKRPDQITIAGWLPRGPTGKLAIRTLRKLLTGELGAEVVATWDKWRLGRAPISDKPALERLVQRALLAGEPIRLLMLWGCGRRAELLDADRRALEQLAALLAAVAGKTPAPPRLTLLFADEHARLNRKPPEVMERYFAAIEARAREAGMETARLGEVWRAAGLERAAIEERAAVAGEAWLASPLRETLTRQARNHADGGDDPELAARRYWLASLAERDAIAARYADSVSLTYTDPVMAPLLPPLPTLYLFPIQSGRSHRPWFID